jgi:hypothetical protein
MKRAQPVPAMVQLSPITFPKRVRHQPTDPCAVTREIGRQFCVLACLDRGNMGVETMALGGTKGVARHQCDDAASRPYRVFDLIETAGNVSRRSKLTCEHFVANARWEGFPTQRRCDLFMRPHQRPNIECFEASRTLFQPHPAPFAPVERSSNGGSFLFWVSGGMRGLKRGVQLRTNKPGKPQATFHPLKALSDESLRSGKIGFGAHRSLPVLLILTDIALRVQATGLGTAAPAAFPGRGRLVTGRIMLGGGVCVRVACSGAWKPLMGGSCSRAIICRWHMSRNDCGDACDDVRGRETLAYVQGESLSV